MRVIVYRYINMWNQGQYTHFVRKDYGSIHDGLEAFRDGHTQFWRKFLQNKDKKRCALCMQLMGVTTTIASEPSALLIIRLRPSRYNTNGSIVFDETLDFGGYSYSLFCALYISRSQYPGYHAYYFNGSAPSCEEYETMTRGAEILIYCMS